MVMMMVVAVPLVMGGGGGVRDTSWGDIRYDVGDIDGGVDVLAVVVDTTILVLV